MLGQVHGEGKYIWTTGEFYDGQWKKGLKEGYGVWKGVANDTYIGEWKDNKPYGFGKHVWGSLDQYEGEWKACLRHGQGCDKFQNDDMYVGEYCWGKAEGYG